MADFTLQDVNGKAHRLYEFEGKKAVAVIFIATRCPYSNAFNHVMANLAHAYESRGVAFIGINANKAALGFRNSRSASLRRLFALRDSFRTTAAQGNC